MNIFTTASGAAQANYNTPYQTTEPISYGATGLMSFDYGGSHDYYDNQQSIFNAMGYLTTALILQTEPSVQQFDPTGGILTHTFYNQFTQ